MLPEVWPEVFQYFYKANELTFENTLFVNLLLCDVRYNWDFLRFVLRSLFMCMFRLQYVVIVMPPDCEQCRLLTNSEAIVLFSLCRIVINFSGKILKYFVKMLPKVSRYRKMLRDSQALLVAFRDRLLPQLKIRYAVYGNNSKINDKSNYVYFFMV